MSGLETITLNFDGELIGMITVIPFLRFGIIYLIGFANLLHFGFGKIKATGNFPRFQYPVCV